MFNPGSDRVIAFASAFELGDWQLADKLYAELGEIPFSYHLSAHDDYETYYDFLIGNAQIDYQNFRLKDKHGAFDLKSGRAPDGKERLIYEDYLLNCSSTSSTLCFRSFDALANLANFAFDLYHARRYGFDVNHIDEFGRSLLEESIKSGYIGRIRILRSLGARTGTLTPPDKAHPDQEEMMPRHHSGWWSPESETELQVYKQRLKLLQALLDADYSAADHILATTPEALVKITLAEYIQLEAFHHAQPGTASLSYLLDRRAGLNGPGIEHIGLFGRTPLDAAIECGHRQAVVWLRSLGARSFWELWLEARGRLDELKGTFLRSPQRLGQPLNETRKRQLRHARSDDFLLACRNSKLDAVSAALETGMDVIDAAEAFTIAFEHQQLDLARLLVQAGLHPSLLRPHLLALLRGFPLHEPDAWLGLMLEAGVAVNFFDLSGSPFKPDPIMTPLDHAYVAEKGDWMRSLQHFGALRFEEMLKLLD